MTSTPPPTAALVEAADISKLSPEIENIELLWQFKLSDEAKKKNKG